MNPKEVIEWLTERKENSLHIGASKRGADGWMSDAQYFAAAIKLCEEAMQGRAE